MPTKGVELSIPAFSMSDAFRGHSHLFQLCLSIAQRTEMDSLEQASVHLHRACTRSTWQIKSFLSQLTD